MLSIKCIGEKLQKQNEKKEIGEENEKKQKYIDTMKNGLGKTGIERRATRSFTQKIQKDLLIMKKDKELDELYQKIFADTIEHMKNYEPQMVAGTLMAIAIRLYKTNLTDDGFKDMLDTIIECEVEPYNIPKKVLH